MSLNGIPTGSSLPQGWADAPIGEIADIVRGVSFPKDAKVGSSSEGYVACLRTTNVQRKVEWDDLWFVPSRYVKRSEQMVSLGDTLISTANSRELVGKVALVSSLPVPATLGAFIALIRFPASVSRRFFFYELSSARVQETIRDSASTTTNISNVSTAKLAAMHVRIAPLAEQHRIVAEIEEQFTRLDKAVATLERAQINLRRYRAAVLKAACEGRLVPTEAELARSEGREYEPAGALLVRILDEDRARWEADQLTKLEVASKHHKDDKWKAKYVEPEPPKTNALPALPEGWAWANIGQLASSGPQNGLYKPKSTYGSGIPIIRIEDYQDDWIRPRESLSLLMASEEELRMYGLQEGDLLINRVNSPSHLGKSLVVPPALAPAVFESNIMRLSTAADVLPQWIAFYTRSRDGRSRLTSQAKWAVNQASINQTDVCSTPVPLPPFAEQQRIVTEVERLMSIINGQGLIIDRSLSRSERLRQAILKLAFEGRIAEQDPNDEPGSSLLERIKTDRGASGTGKPPARQRRAATAKIKLEEARS